MNNQQQQVDVGTLLNSISQMLEENQGKLNEVDEGPGGGTHGDRVAQAFRTAAQAAQEAGTDDAGEQLRVAAAAMRQNGQGKSIAYYANGLQSAASKFMGQSGISLTSLLPFLQSFLGGVRKGNPAQPGQGTMIDALLPAVTSLLGANKQGADPGQAAIDALGSAVQGARGTIGARGNGVDPGAASAATGVLGGIVKALLPGIMGAVVGGLTSRRGQPQAQTQPQILSEPGYGDVQSQGGGSGLGDILGRITGGGGSQQPDTDGGSGGLGGLIGGLLGGGNDDTSRQQQSGKPGWWPF